MLLIGDLDNRDLSEKLGSELSLPVIYPDLHIFPDGEMRIRVMEDVTDQEIILLKTHTSPVDSNVLQTMFLLDALKRNGAGLVTVVIPYLGYMRGDHMFRNGEGVPLEVVIKMLETFGAAKVVIIDPHSIKIPEMFTIPVANLSALEVFAGKIKSMNLDQHAYTLVTPDMGGIRRIKILSELLGNAPYATIEKNRDLETGAVEAAEVEGEIKKVIFVVDDMISSGGTIIKALDALREKGAEKMYVMATHAVFSENAPQLLERSKAKKVFVTDSMPISSQKQFKKLEVISLAPMIAKSLKG
ncbi:MAG: ribose-phosphate diphosphokinase [Candidatus Levyibacteriota bacterium]